LFFFETTPKLDAISISPIRDNEPTAAPVCGNNVGFSGVCGDVGLPGACGDIGLSGVCGDIGLPGVCGDAGLSGTCG